MARWPAQRATRKFFKGSPVENKGATRGHKGPQAGHTGPQGATSGPHRATAGPVARCGPLVAPWRTCVRVLAGNQHVLQSEHAFAYWLATSTCFKANMRSRTGWQPTRPLKQTCVRVLAAYFPTPSPYSMLIFLNICFDFFNVQGFFV